MRYWVVITIILGFSFLAFKYAPDKAKAPDFFFGASNAAFQVEGSPQDSDWREWTRTSYQDGTAHISDKSNAEQVTKIRRIVEELGLSIADPAETREILALKGKADVRI